MTALLPELAMPPTVKRTVALPDSIDITGATDMSGPLNEFWARLEPGTRVVFPQRGRILAERGLMARDRMNIETLGRDSALLLNTFGETQQPWPWPHGERTPTDHGKVRNWPRMRSAVTVMGGTLNSFDRLHTVGPATAPKYLGESYEEQAGFHLDATNHVSISNCNVSGMPGDAVAISHGKLFFSGTIPATPTDHVTITGGTFTNVGRQAVSVVCGSNVAVIGSKINGTGRSAFNVEVPVDDLDYMVDRVMVRDIVAQGVSNVFFANLGAGNLVANITVANCVSDNVGVSIEGRPASAGRRRGFTINGLRSTREYGHASPIALGRFRHIDDLEILDYQSLITSRLMEGQRVVYAGVAVELTDINGVAIDSSGFTRDMRPKVTGPKYEGGIRPFHAINVTDLQPI